MRRSRLGDRKRDSVLHPVLLALAVSTAVIVPTELSRAGPLGG